MLRIFAHKSKCGVPSFAIGFQLVVANLLLLTQSFEAVLEFIQFGLTLCSFFTVLGVIVLRFTKPRIHGHIALGAIRRRRLSSYR